LVPIHGTHRGRSRPAWSNRRPEDVAGKLFEPLAIVRRDGDVGVQVEAVEVAWRVPVEVTQGAPGTRPICTPPKPR
jgi:hypothetical protein